MKSVWEPNYEASSFSAFVGQKQHFLSNLIHALIHEDLVAEDLLPYVIPLS